MVWGPDNGDALAERKPRRSYMLKADCITASGQASVVRVRNMSATGMGAIVEGGMGFVDGEAIQITFPGMSKIGGTVIWIKDRGFGVTFDRPVDPELIRKGAYQGLPAFEVSKHHQVTNAGYSRGPLRSV